MYNLKIFKEKKVIITGHTGFKGSWLALWLHHLGANILGISNKYSTSPNHFKLLKPHLKINNINLDISNLNKLETVIKYYKPDFVFHLAAQALVGKSYLDPINTFRSNTIGTLNLLQSLRKLKKKCTAIIITSDKSYKNLEINRGYKEEDLLGGKDPYSASKAAAEMILHCYSNIFFDKKSNIKISIARAGNVIGGGDWSQDRLIPDCVKSWAIKKKVILRNPHSTRPWQHVLEAISGYLFLALELNKKKSLHGEAFNFGPNNKVNKDVISLVRIMKKFWKNVDWKLNKSKSKKIFESNLLKLNSNKSKKILNWETILSFNEVSKMTIDWYKNYYSNKINTQKFSLEQIKYYQKLLIKRKKIK
tara:strand:+ start:4042 stop:5130 length:1089 start_codon:yes stop_codon:yes gene_type:complete